MDNYFDRPELSHSDLMLINKSIEHYLCKGNFESTDAMDVGSAFHCYILESHKFNDLYVIKPEGMKFTTKDGKEWQANNLDKVIISYEDFKWFELMQRKITDHPLNYLLQGENIEVEKELYFEYEGVQCRSKLDYINHDLKICFDFKTISDCSKAESECKFRYCSQAYFYQVALYQNFNSIYRCIDIFTEKSYPHGIKFCEFGAETLNAGANKIHKAIDKYKIYRTGTDLGYKEYIGYSDKLIEV